MKNDNVLSMGKFEEGGHHLVSNWIKKIADYGMNSSILGGCQ